MKEIIGLVAVRTQSSRLKNKAFRMLSGKPVLEVLADRLYRTPYLDDFIICTTRSESDDIIEEFCRTRFLKVFRGEEENVLKRFVEASRTAPSEYVVRITGDNPLTDFESMNGCYNYLKQKRADYSRPVGVPLGTAAEVIRTESLYQLLDRSLTPELSEYMTYFFELAPFIKSDLYRVEPELCMPDLRLTIDYEEDLAFVESLLKNFGGHVPPLKSIIEYCRKLGDYPKADSSKAGGEELKGQIKFR